jgi:hypothetical protein
MIQDLAAVLQEQCQLDLAECFIDGSFVAAKKGAAMSGLEKTARTRCLC